MKQKARYHGGLVFLGAREGAIDRFSRIVATTFEDYGHPVERQSTLSETQARIVTAQYTLKLSLDAAPYSGRLLETAAPDEAIPDTAPRQRIELSLCPAMAEGEDRDITELLLVVMLYRMVDAYRAQQIEWLDPDTLLTVKQFLGAFASVSPRRVRGRQQIISPKAGRFGPVEPMAQDLSEQADVILGTAPQMDLEETGLTTLTEEEALALAFRYEPQPSELIFLQPEPDPQSDVRRLTSWAMTGMLAFLSGPVAASMAAVNLIRGEDFRLNTQVLSLTVFVSSVSKSGLLSQALAFVLV